MAVYILFEFDYKNKTVNCEYYQRTLNVPLRLKRFSTTTKKNAKYLHVRLMGYNVPLPSVDPLPHVMAECQRIP